MRRISAILLTMLLLLSCAPPAAAAAAPGVTCRTVAGGTFLQAEGVEGGVYGAQLTVTVPGSCPDPVFVPAGREVYSPGCTVEEGEGRTRITLYLTSDSPLNSGAVLPLGTLNTGGVSLPAAGELTLLDRGLTAAAYTVTLRPVSSGGGGSRPSRPSRPSGGQDGGEKETDPPPEERPEDAAPPFRDAGESDWYYDAVRYVYARGMMSGTDPVTFSPNAAATRGMIVTILHRLEGSPAAGTADFPDVAPAQYYAEPIAWASANGLVTGYDTGRFGPEDPITRQQLAAILYRYAGSRGYDTAVRGSIDGFSDAAAVNGYAVDPLRWAVGAGLISGMGDGTLSPAGSATRAQVAAILMRFCENVAGEAEAG